MASSQNGTVHGAYSAEEKAAAQYMRELLREVEQALKTVRK